MVSRLAFHVPVCAAPSAGPRWRSPVVDCGASECELTEVGRPIHGRTPPGGAEPCSRTSPLTYAERAEVIELISGGRLARCTVELPDRLRTRHWESVVLVMLGLDQRLGWPAAGWKIGAASQDVRRLEGMPTPSPGRLYRDRMFASSAEIPASLFINYRETECEFAFALGRDLSPRNWEYTEAEVAGVVASAFPVLEIGDMVFADWYGASGYFGPSLDNGGGAALVYGQPIVGWESRDLARAHVELRLNGRFVKDGLGSAAMGHPLTSLTWMANWASQRGIALKQGEVISTGTLTGHCFVAVGDQVVADFGPLGKVEVNYAFPRHQNASKGPQTKG